MDFGELLRRTVASDADDIFQPRITWRDRIRQREEAPQVERALGLDFELGERDAAFRRAGDIADRQGWAMDNPAYRQMFTSLYLPEATKEQANWYNEMQRVTTSAENSVALQRVFGTIDVRDLLSKVTTPTLVGPFESGRALAARIPGARFIAVESPNHLLLETDPGWPKYARVVEEFLES